MLEIIPAIDLKGGRCVRLVQGEMDRETRYFDDPLEAARLWASEGARRIHVVDLDGAVSGSPRNLEAVRRIVEETPVAVQVGGGIRTESDLKRYLGIGVDRVVLGTMACRDPKGVKELADRYPARILVGIDARNGFVAVEGWRETTRLPAVELIGAYPGSPIAGVVYTDIHRDGMLTGPNLEAIRDFCAVCPFPVIASGGVTTPEDIAALAEFVPAGLAAAIVGKALYTGRLTYREAVRAAQGRDRKSG